MANGIGRPPAPELWLACREAIDAAAADVAIAGVRAADAGDNPSWRAVLAAVEAAATGDESRWQDTLHIALEQGLRLIAVDALEGVAVAAARADSPGQSLRLLAAAARLRDETAYRWRFGFEQRAIGAALAATHDALGGDVDAVAAEGRRLDWRDAAAYAHRIRRSASDLSAAEPHPQASAKRQQAWLSGGRCAGRKHRPPGLDEARENATMGPNRRDTVGNHRVSPLGTSCRTP